MKVLVVNSGSSSLKAQLMETDSGEVLAKAYCQRIGLDKSFMEYKTNEKFVIDFDMPNHKVAFKLFLDTLTSSDKGVIKSLNEIKAIGHRIVNLGEKYNKSIIITKEIFDDMQNYIHFAPLHNPAAMSGIKACLELMPNVKNVGVFDTAFHSTMPEQAYIYALPYEFYKNNGIRRYGAHGTSHRYIALKCKEIFGDLKGKKIISCHIGSGSSICAIKDGKSIDTSMGYTPLAGVVMGTRSGDIDPAIIKDIMSIKNCSVDEAIDLLNKKSGLLGIAGYSDMRDIEANIDNKVVKLAFDVMVYSIKKYIGAYAAVMNGVDLIVFTGGIGENNSRLRRRVCENLSYLGLKFDYEANVATGKDTLISLPDSKVKVAVITTNEELVIARDTMHIVMNENE